MPNPFEQNVEPNKAPAQGDVRLRFLDDLRPPLSPLTRTFDDSMRSFDDSVQSYRDSLRTLPEAKQLEFHMLINQGKGLNGNLELQERFPELYKKALVVAGRYDNVMRTPKETPGYLQHTRIPGMTDAMTEAQAKAAKLIAAKQAEAAYTITDLRFLPSDDTLLQCTIDETAMLLKQSFARTSDQKDGLANLDLLLKRFPRGPALGQALSDINDLLNAPDSKLLSQTELRKIAFQTLRHAARPDEIDQGHHNTCNVTAVEEVLFTHYPQIATRIIRQASLEGKMRTTDVPLASLEAGKEEKPLHTADGERSHASQVFQVATINWIKAFTASGHRYIQMQPETEGDTGERLVLRNGTFFKANGVEVQSPDLSTYDIAMTLRALTGKTGLVLHGLADGVPKQRADDLTASLARRGCQLLASKEALMDQAETARKERKIMYVRTGTAAIPGAGSGHVVVITDADRFRDRIAISNFWGKSRGYDRWISASDLWDAMHDTK